MRSAREVAIELLCERGYAASPADVDAVAAAILKDREAVREACAAEADARLEHWRKNYQDNVAAGCEFPLYNMGCRAEASTVGKRIRALDLSGGTPGERR